MENSKLRCLQHGQLVMKIKSWTHGSEMFLCSILVPYHDGKSSYLQEEIFSLRHLD